eukprot:808303-Pleurochrysis_carterae.AAC.1
MSILFVTTSTLHKDKPSIVEETKNLADGGCFSSSQGAALQVLYAAIQLALTLIYLAVLLIKGIKLSAKASDGSSGQVKPQRLPATLVPFYVLFVLLPSHCICS